MNLTKPITTLIDELTKAEQAKKEQSQKLEVLQGEFDADSTAERWKKIIDGRNELEFRTRLHAAALLRHDLAVQEEQARIVREAEEARLKAIAANVKARADVDARIAKAAELLVKLYLEDSELVHELSVLGGPGAYYNFKPAMNNAVAHAFQKHGKAAELSVR